MPIQKNIRCNTFLHKVSVEFIFATFFAYITSFIWNCIYFLFVRPTDNPESYIFPTIERWIIWNSIFFSIFLGYAKLITKHYVRNNKQSYNLNIVLKHFGIVFMVDVCIIIQFLVFFSPKWFLLYFSIPVYFTVVYISNKFHKKL